MIFGPSHGGVPLGVALCGVTQGVRSAGEEDPGKQEWWRVEFKAIQERFQASLRQYKDLGDKGCMFEVELPVGGDAARNPKVTIVAFVPGRYPVSRPRMAVIDRHGGVPRTVMEQLAQCVRGVTTQAEAAAGPAVLLALERAEHLVAPMKNNSSAGVCPENVCEEMGMIMLRQLSQRGGSQGCLILPISALPSNEAFGAFVSIPAGGTFQLVPQASTVSSPPGTWSVQAHSSPETSCSSSSRATEEVSTAAATSANSITSTASVPLKPPGNWSMEDSCVSLTSKISQDGPASIGAPSRPPGSWSDQMDKKIVKDHALVPVPTTHPQCLVDENAGTRLPQLRKILRSNARSSVSTCSSGFSEIFDEDSSDSSSDDDSSTDSEEEEESGTDRAEYLLIQEQLNQNIRTRVSAHRQVLA